MIDSFRKEGRFSNVLISRLKVSDGVVSQIRLGDEFALSHLSSGDGFDLGPAEGPEGVHECDADVSFDGSAFGGS